MVVFRRAMFLMGVVSPFEIQEGNASERPFALPIAVFQGSVLNLATRTRNLRT